MILPIVEMQVMKMGVQLSEMTAAHVPQVIELWQASEGVLLTPTDNVRDLTIYFERNPGLSQVAIEAEKVVGAVLAGHDGRRGYLHHLAVAPQYQRQGIGTQLVEACLKKLEREGISQCNLFLVEDNHAGHEFWSKFQFSTWPTLRLMSRPLAPKPDA